MAIPAGNFYNSFFQPVSNLINQNQANPISTNLISKGSLIVFAYQFWINDPYPLVIVTDYVPGNRIRGVNLHYLTFPFIKELLRTGCENPTFSYGNVKPNQYISSAFRSYKWQGIRQIKKLDCKFLLNVMGTVRSFDPSEVQAIRESVQEQIRRIVNEKANDITGV